MSLHIDMKMIRSSNCSGWTLFSSSVLWISGSNCSDVCPGKTVRSNSTGSPSIQSNSRYSRNYVNHLIFRFQASIDWGYSYILPRESTENVYLCFRQHDCSVVQRSRSRPRNCIPFDSRYPLLNQDQFLWSIEQLLDLFEVRVLGGTQILLIILSKMHCRFQCRWQKKNSPVRRVDVGVTHLVSLWTTQFPSYMWIDFLKMANTVPGYLKVVVI